jgi:ABC-2 type transport system permease protein
MQRLLGLAIAGNVPDFRTEAVKPTGSLAYDVSLISVLLFSLFVGGATLGLSVVTERETALSLLWRSVPCRGRYVMTSSCRGDSERGRHGRRVPHHGYGGNPPGFSCSRSRAYRSWAAAARPRRACENQIASVGVLKLIMPLSLVLPISAVFVPARWHFLYYWFPMYWQYAAIDALHGADLRLSRFMTLAVACRGSPWRCGFLQREPN